MARVKICGITTAEALAAAAGADWVGFVFVPESPRAIAPGQAAGLVAGVPGCPERVGLFVDPTEAEIRAVLAVLPLSALQLYAGPARAAALRRRFGLPVWRAVSVGTAGDLPDAPGGVDALVLDAPPPATSAIPGGNALGFDHRLLAGWRAPLPWLLAGGLDATNVAGAIAATGALAVDVSSGVESARGVKDPARIRAFIAAARGDKRG